MKFDPKTADEIAAETLLPAGTYPFEVIAAKDAFSKAGNEMIKLKLGVFSGDDCVHVFDYLLEKLPFKLRHFAETTGQLAKYEKGELLAADCERKSGYCKIAIESDNPSYPQKNSVKDYVVPVSDAKSSAKVEKPANAARPAMSVAHRASMAAQTPAADPFSDDIPF